MEHPNLFAKNYSKQILIVKRVNLANVIERVEEFLFDKIKFSPEMCSQIKVIKTFNVFMGACVCVCAKTLISLHLFTQWKIFTRNRKLIQSHITHGKHL